VTISLTVCSKTIQVMMEDNFFNQIDFTEDVETIFLDSSFLERAISLNGSSKVYKFKTINFIAATNVNFLRNFNPRKFPCLERLKFLNQILMG
jgi:hypothetical protein